MQLSWSSISAGATAAAVSLGSSVQALGATAAASVHALPTVVGGGVQAMSQGATAAASALPASMPQAVQAGATGSAQLASDLAVVEKPAKAIAAGLPRSTVLLRTASFLSKALPLVAIGASTLSGARIVHDQGPDALLNTKQGRGAVLGAMGGVLLLVPHPAGQLAAAGVLGVTAANHFDGLRRFDQPAT
ncbi:MAG: hypothetical protein JWM86_1581 [Thermoleophilia bacterium]|nr:hypothetical protein [Thermoleophilia bacterium]